MMDRNSTSVSGANYNARGQMQPQQPKQGTPSLETWDGYLEKYSKSVQGTLHL
jgi:hypothetical protein